MFNNNNKSSKIGMSVFSILGVFTALLCHVPSAHATEVTHAMAGDDGIWQVPSSWREPIEVFDDDVFIDVTNYNLSCASGSWAIIFYETQGGGVINNRGSKATIESATGIGIYLYHAKSVTIENVFAKGANWGILAEESNGGDISHVDVYGKTMDGIWMTNCNYNSLDDIWAYGNGRHGIVIYGGTRNWIEHSDGRANNNNGITMSNTSDFYINDSGAEHNFDGFVFVNSSGKIEQCLADYNDNYGYVDRNMNSTIINWGLDNDVIQNGVDYAWIWRR